MRYFGMYSRTKTNQSGAGVRRTLDGKIVLTVAVWDEDEYPGYFDRICWDDKVNFGPVEQLQIGKVSPFSKIPKRFIPADRASWLGTKPGLFVPLNLFIPTMEEAQEIARVICAGMNVPAGISKELFLNLLQSNLPRLDMDELMAILNQAG